MGDIIRILVDRLVGRGIESRTIPAYIRDLAHAISDNTESSLLELNRRMQLLGWDDFELDDHTLQLITAVLELDDRHSWERGTTPSTHPSINPARERNYEAEIQSGS
jgi:hypothetical protein